MNRVPEPTLYLLMRSDMASMTPGRIAAQASHATSLFETRMQAGPADESYQAWKNSADGFGRAIVLGINSYYFDYKLVPAVNVGLLVVPAGLVRDPDYFIKDGEVTHHTSVLTGGYVFLPDNSFHALEKFKERKFYAYASEAEDLMLTVNLITMIQELDLL